MMDYHAVHGHDVASFPTSETHRLPTVSASQALDGLESQPSDCIPSGLESLDAALSGSPDANAGVAHYSSGVRRGQVTDIWGPPGTGKTAFGIQLSANTIHDGNGVVWIDCFHAISAHRIAQVLETVKDERQKSGETSAVDDVSSSLTQYHCLTLPHLMALIGRPTKDSIKTNVSLVVISSLTALINSALPKPQGSAASNKGPYGSTPAAKRLQVLQYIITALQKLAATRNCAVVLLSQCATRMQSERSAALVPAVNATIWELGISTRLVLYKDWVWQGGQLRSASMVRLQKLDGKTLSDSEHHVSAFVVNKTGIAGIQYEFQDTSLARRGMQPKRKLADTGLEVVGSEDDEDYEWGDEDESAVSPPPRRQWQGSEDILLGLDVGQSEADTESDDEEGSRSIVGAEAQFEAEVGLSAGKAPSP